MNLSTSTLAMLDLIAKLTTVLLLGFVAASFMRRSSAARRSLAWLAVFVATAMLPAAFIVQPVWTWTVPLPGETADMRQRNPFAPVSVRLDEARTSTGSVAEFPSPSSLVRRDSLLPKLSSSQWLLLACLGVSAILLVRRLLGSWQLWRLRVSESDKRAVIFVERLRCDHSMRRAIRVRQSSQAAVPMTWGMFRPVLLLPADSTSWGDDDLQAAIRHEFAHIRHWDAAKRWLAAFVSAFCWPHPLVWMAARAWRLEQERACDDFVIRSGSRPDAYAAQILSAAKSYRQHGFHHPAALVMAMPSGLETRIRSATADDIERSPCSRGFRLAAITTVLATGSLSALFQIRAEEKKPPAKLADQPVSILIQGSFFSVSKGAVAMNNPGGIPFFEPQAGFDGVFTPEQFVLYRQQLEKVKGVRLWAQPAIHAQSGREAVISAGRRGAGGAKGRPAADSAAKLTMIPTVGSNNKVIDFNIAVQFGDKSLHEDDGGFKVGVTVFPGQTIMLRGRDPAFPDDEQLMFLTPSLVVKKPAIPENFPEPSKKPGQASSSGRFIRMQSKFVEVAAGQPVSAFPALDRAMTGKTVTLSDGEMQELWRAISQRKGIDLLSAPSVTTRPGKEATVEVIKEFVYPTEFEFNKDGQLVPISFDLLPLGIIVKVNPKWMADGTIQIKPATATVNNFHGYLRGGLGLLESDDENKWRLTEAKKALGREIPPPKPDRSRFFDLSIIESAKQELEKEPLKKEEITVPIFSTHQWTGEARLKPGEWQVSFLKLKGRNAKPEHARQIWVFVSATAIANPSATGASTKPQNGQ